MSSDVPTYGHRQGDMLCLSGGDSDAFTVEGEEGSLALQLPPHGEYDGVRLSVASEMGAPGETLAARFVE